MKIKSKEIKQLNVTAAFTEIDHASITVQKMREVLDLNETEKKNSPFFEIPGVKSLVVPSRQKDIAFESNKLSVNDKGGKEPKDSDFTKQSNRRKLEEKGIEIINF